VTHGWPSLSAFWKGSEITRYFADIRGEDDIGKEILVFSVLIWKWEREKTRKAKGIVDRCQRAAHQSNFQGFALCFTCATQWQVGAMPGHHLLCNFSRLHWTLSPLISQWIKCKQGRLLCRDVLNRTHYVIPSKLGSSSHHLRLWYHISRCISIHLANQIPACGNNYSNGHMQLRFSFQLRYCTHITYNH